MSIVAIMLIARNSPVIEFCVSHEGYDVTKFSLMIDPTMQMVNNNVLSYDDFIGDQIVCFFILNKKLNSLTICCSINLNVSYAHRTN